jgi:hypothetical protein
MLQKKCEQRQHGKLWRRWSYFHIYNERKWKEKLGKKKWITLKRWKRAATKDDPKMKNQWEIATMVR